MPMNFWKDTFRANTATAEYQWAPDVVGLSNGNFLVAWSDDNDSTAPQTGRDIVGQIFDPAGNKIGGPIVLNAGWGDIRNEHDVSLAATDDGGFVITYEYASGGDDDLLFRRFDADGVATQNANVVADVSGSSTSYGNPQMVMRPDGTSIVVYEKSDGATQEIAFRVISSTGTAGSETILRTDSGGTDDPRDVSVSVLADGRVAVAFEESDSGQVGIEYRIINTDNSMGSVPNVSTNYPAVDPDVTGLSDGGWVITWREGSTDLMGRIYNSDGTTRTGPIGLATSVDDTKGVPQVVGLREGGFALAWIDYTDNEISVRAFNADGSQNGIKRDLPWEAYDAYNLEMTETADGRLVLSWEEYTDNTYVNSEIYSAIMDPRDDNFDVDAGVSLARLNGGQMNGSAGVDFMYGLEGQDHLRGLQGNDRLWGNTNNDELEGGKGSDRLKGEKGNDFLGGDKGYDTLWGGKGRDTIEGDAGTDTAYGGDGNDRIWGGSENDKLYGDVGTDTVYGGSGSDDIFGGKGHDVLYGNANGSRRDLIVGNDGNDRIFGGDGVDWIRGNNGQDRMIGGAGADRIVGGNGADTFVYNAASESRTGSDRRDVILDFSSPEGDMIDLSSIDADTTRGGNQAFDFIGTAGFSDAGQLRAKVQGGDIILQADRNGDGSADMEIKLESPSAIDTFDFFL